MDIEWQARWSGGMKESAVLLRTNGELIRQSQFARHIRHISGGSELYRYDVQPGERVIHLYVSGSGRTELATDLCTPKSWGSWDEAERELGLAEGALGQVFRF